jgi:hypothetical protein
MAILASANGLTQWLLGSGTRQGAWSGLSGRTPSASVAGKNDRPALATLQKQALSLQAEADHDVWAGQADRLDGLVSQISSLLSKVDQYLSGRSSEDGTDGHAGRSALSSLLNTVNATLAELSMVVPARGVTGGASASVISRLVDRTVDLAGQAGIGLRKSSMTTIASGIGIRAPNLVDLMV